MARRALGLRLPGPPASLALALSILCALLLSGSLPAASAKHSPKKDTLETSSAPAAGAAPAAEAAPAPAPAVKPPKHRAQGRGPNAAAGPGGGGAAASETTAPAAGGDVHTTRKDAAATRAAERKARRVSEKAGAKTTPEGGAGSANTLAKPQAQTGKSKHEREREREQRKRERKAEKEAPRETKKEREAREARETSEAEEAAHRPAPVVLADGAPVAALATPAAAGPAVATPTSTVPTILSERAAHSSGGRRTVSSARRRTALQRAAAKGALATTPVALPTGPKASAKATGHHVAAHNRRRAASGPGSQLVTTVTRIIGVVPPLLWLLVGALGLLAIAFAVTSRLSARRARALARQRQALLEDVGLMQAALLPELPARLGPVATTAAYRPASGPAAGGDFYDVFALQDGQVAVIVGDVSGHGREALPHTTLLRFTLRAYMEAGLGPRESLRAAAPVLERQLGGSFATVVLAVYNPRERTLTYSCAGHPHPLMTGLSPEATITACSAPPIGADRTTGTRQTVVSIPGATVVCLYTDGVIEARVDDELFGVERLSGSLGAIATSATAASLLDRVSEEADRRPDDMAACVLRIEGGSERPEIAIEELELDQGELGRGRVRRFLLATGLDEGEIERTLESAREISGAHGSALLTLRRGEGRPRITVTHDNVAPLRARAMARTQEVAL